MQIRQLLTILGIYLSQAHAVTLGEPDGIQSIVSLVTAPHQLLKSRELSPAQEISLRESPYLYSHQLAAGFTETGNSLLYVGKGPGEQHTALIQGSLLGYSHTIVQDLPEGVKTERLRIYRDSLYSRIYDLAVGLGREEWSKHSEAALKNLRNELQQVILAHEKVRVTPAGNAEVLAKIKNMVQKFKEEHRSLLEKMSQIKEHTKTHLPYNFNLGDMKYLEVENVDKALAQTNGAGHTEAFPVNFSIHEPPVPKKIPVAPTHINTPAQLPASSPQVAAAP